jgi:hypothetical protein
MSFELKDNKGRILVHMNRKGKLALSRYPDLSEEEITNLTEFFHEMSGKNPVDIKSFLKFKNDDEKFCS